MTAGACVSWPFLICVIANKVSVKQNVYISKWFTVFILAVISQWSSYRNVSSSPSSFCLLLWRIPSGSAPLSTDEWFISHAVNEMLCLHTRPTNMFDDSEPRQISHVFQQIIVSTSLPWCEESCPVHAVHAQDRKELPESMHPKMWHVGWLIQWHVLNSPLCLASEWGLHCTYWGQLSESRNPDL